MSQQDSKHQKLSDYLRQPNPEIDCSQCGTGGNTKSAYKQPPFPAEIKEWTDFGLPSLDAACGGFLKANMERKFPLRNHSDAREHPNTVIPDEDCLKIFQGKWNQVIVNRALTAIQKYPLDLLPDEAVHMYPGGHARKKAKKGEKKQKPDWAGVLRPKEFPNDSRPSNESRNILPGETKPSCKWTIAKFQEARATSKLGAKHNLSKPITQLYSYCLKWNARYSYLITDRELVVFRIDPKH
ncbi:MAG: hypothetical protein Q9181_008184, partial [Wetmoreana brouardii]